MRYKIKLLDSLSLIIVKINDEYHNNADVRHQKGTKK